MSFQSASKANGSSNREAKGFLFLLFILIMPFIVQYTYRSFFYKPQKTGLSILYLSDTCEQKKEFKTHSYSHSEKVSVAAPVKLEVNAKRSYATVELNTADSAILETLPGIGPSFASRIIKYRTLLGGYVKVEQLKEVYGMPEETYERIKPLCTINRSSIKMISAELLWANPYKFYHPYLSKELKEAITAKKKATDYSVGALKELLEASNEKLGWYIGW